MTERRPRRGQRNTAARSSPTQISLGWSPFHTAAEDYYAAGYLPIPLPQGKKYPPPKGVPNGIDYTDTTLAAWLATSQPRNIGTIVPDGCVVLDIDGAPGQETLKELENKFGELPPTWVSFRGDPDRYHLWFACRQGISWPGKLGTGLDIIYRHYRYMVAPPSLHPDGGQYRWANMRDKALRISNGYFPGIDEFTDLPDSWYALANAGDYVYRERAQVDARLWIKEHGGGKPCPEIKRVVKHHVSEIRKHADLGGMHDSMVNAVWSVLAEVSQGHNGGYAGLKRLRRTFFAQAEGSGRRDDSAAETEWARACIGAIEKTAIERVRDDDPCVIEEAERKLDPARFFVKENGGFQARSFRDAVELTGRLATSSAGIIYRYTDGLWVPDGDKEIVRRSVRLLGERYRPSHAQNVQSAIGSREPFITDDRQDKQFLNLPNGLLDWRTGELQPHSEHIVSTTRIPIEWDENAECPEIDQFFGEVFPADAAELAYEILGYMLYNDNPLHKAILLYGSGRNGKGTFIRLARMLVGHNNISAVTPQALDSSQFSSAQLYGKLANLVGDVDPRIFKSTEQFKQLTGGDEMMAQHKHKDPFVFICRALMIAAFNSLPRTADTTEGFFSRWVVVPFTAFFPAGVADITLIDRLTSQRELQGLLRASVGGLQQVMRKGRFTLPASVAKATERFKMEADPMRGFIEEMVGQSETRAFLPRTQLYGAYSAWASLNGFHAMSAQLFYEKFSTAVSDTFGVPVQSALLAGVRGYRGIVLQ